MAGIGFTLRKIYGKGDIGGIIQATLSGIMIVAGPWLISILTLTMISRIVFANFTGVNTRLFFATMVYSYAAGLVLFGGVQFIFTRMVADKIYSGLERHGAGLLLSFNVLITLFIPLILWPVLWHTNPSIEYLRLYKLSITVLFTAINQIWLVMIFNSLLKWYGRILIVYITGMVCGAALIWILTPLYGTSGAMAGFALGHLIISIGLHILAFIAYPPENPLKGLKESVGYFSKYQALFWTGVFYNGSLWADKFVAWITLGTAVTGTPFLLFDPYDMAVYFANLTIIPGLYYFVVFFETDYFVYLKRYMIHLSSSPLRLIMTAKRALKDNTIHHFIEQTKLQGAVTITLFLLSPWLVNTFFKYDTHVSILLFSLAAVLFHLLFLTLLNLLFYLELYKDALGLSSLFIILSTTLSLVLYPQWGSFLAGSSFLISGMICSAFGLFLYYYRLGELDRLMLTRFS